MAVVHRVAHVVAAVIDSVPADRVGIAAEDTGPILGLRAEINPARSAIAETTNVNRPFIEATLF
jgi:hypothetical protein